MGRNMGTTSLSLSISNYLCNKHLKSVAYIELNTTNEIHLLNPKLKHMKEKFQFMGIDFFPNVTLLDISDILNLKYQYFILDFGVLNTYTAKEFNRCQARIAICDHAKWKKNLIEDFLHNKEIWNNSSWDNLILTGKMNKNQCRHFRLEHGRNIIPIPTIPNPFQLTSEVFDFFEQLLKRSLYHNDN